MNEDMIKQYFNMDPSPNFIKMLSFTRDISTKEHLLLLDFIATSSEKLFHCFKNIFNQTNNQFKFDTIMIING